MEKVGFVGLGIMGKPMAKNLIRAGIELWVNDLNREAVEELEAEGAHSISLEKMGKECSIIFLILPNGSIVHSVLFGEEGLCSGMREGTLVCDMSSVTPSESRRCASELEKIGVRFVDAPVSGGEPKAIDGTLAFMVGGKTIDFQRLEEYLYKMGSTANLVGDWGSGSVAKLANQIIVNMNIAALSEAFVFAAKAGVDPEKVYQAIRGGLAGSTVMDAKLPMILERNFKPGGKISINHKDIKNVMNTAHEIDVPLPLTSELFEIMQVLKVDGHMDEDHGGIIQYFEKLAHVTVRKQD